MAAPLGVVADHLQRVFFPQRVVRAFGRRRVTGNRRNRVSQVMDLHGIELDFAGWRVERHTLFDLLAVRDAKRWVFVFVAAVLAELLIRRKLRLLRLAEGVVEIQDPVLGRLVSGAERLAVAHGIGNHTDPVIVRHRTEQRLHRAAVAEQIIIVAPTHGDVVALENRGRREDQIGPAGACRHEKVTRHNQLAQGLVFQNPDCPVDIRVLVDQRITGNIVDELDVRAQMVDVF